MSEAYGKIYTDWKADKHPVRIQCIEDFASTAMKLIVGGWKLDGEIMLGQMYVVFEEMDDDLVKGAIHEVTKKERHRPTDSTDIGLS